MIKIVKRYHFISPVIIIVKCSSLIQIFIKQNLVFLNVLTVPLILHCQSFLYLIFTSEKEANLFLKRHLLSNRFDFEVFTPGDVERECFEELCNYEEAREFFVDPDKTVIVSGLQKIDVTGLLIGLIAAGVLVVLTGLLLYYFCKSRCKSRQPPGSRRRHSSIIFRRHEEVSLNPLPPRTDESGLPTYEQAVAVDGRCDVSPPPYPGPAKGLRVFKKSMSLPAS
uniref:Proline rich and Gla domain 4 n=1 Tax=Crocodylus porosus TaxID=8502 RepID=A0A7M4EGB4_CROPO